MNFFFQGKFHSYKNGTNGIHLHGPTGREMDPSDVEEPIHQTNKLPKPHLANQRQDPDPRISKIPWGHVMTTYKH